MISNDIWFNDCHSGTSETSSKYPTPATVNSHCFTHGADQPTGGGDSQFGINTQKKLLQEDNGESEVEVLDQAPWPSYHKLSDNVNPQDTAAPFLICWSNRGTKLREVGLSC
uniref:Uncharacterized protein n=1 Tax=Octactis speculum TaxID=3111310 RepID=A0A7S2H1K1_9STRA|mmetsp:Transcript_60384/g.82849  ORF Transcript_60384/g.82849 Transcript_60384/m.82849 type:complete len:112 (+) Transcript_60384:62-397(+)